ncbi:hypothetical protein [Psychromicrobium sp. YIM B11713]|uniref:hypothetical protein n=1 Tax=Psychromicrobium sp. YIM B11713 TaxID=3145233 RepID=UPI00374EA1B8
MNTYNFSFDPQTVEFSEEDRTISGLILPFGETGYGSAGAAEFSAGSITLPADAASIKLNIEHDAHRPVGTCTSLEERAEGLFASFRIAKTSAGTDLLQEIQEGLRKSFSVEVKDPIVQLGKISAAVLTGCAAVVQPAFKSAAIFSLDEDAAPNESIQMENETTPAETTEVVSAPVQAPAASFSGPIDQAPAVFTALKNGDVQGANFALAQIDITTPGAAVLGKQEVGEIWSSKKVVSRPITDSVENKELTSLLVTGTRKERQMSVADWEGNATEIPSGGTYTNSLVSAEAKLMAGAVRVPGEYLWFGSDDIIGDLYESAVEDYLTKSETKVFTSLSTEAVAATGAFTIVNAVDKAAQTLRGISANLDFVVVSSDIYTTLVNAKTADVPFWFNLGGATVDLANTRATAGVSFRVGDYLPAKTMLVGDRKSFTFYESKDIRLNAVAVANGAYDIALIKANALLVNDPKAVLKFTNVAGL